MADFDKAIELDPDFAAAYCSRGFAYYDKGENEKAESDFEKCMELSQSPGLTEFAEEMLDKIGNEE